MNKIIYFFDFTCPFSYIGYKYLLKLSKTYDIDVLYMPIITHPNIPSNGIKYNKLYSDYDSVKCIYDYAASIAEDENITLNIFDKKFNSYLAITYFFYAVNNDKVNEYMQEIFKCVFELNKNISKVSTIKQILKKLKLNFKEATEDIKSGNYKGYAQELLKECMKYNVNTTPTFVINDKIIVGIHNYNMYKLYLKSK